MSFQQIKGQQVVISFLKEGMRKDRLAHGYLLVGADEQAKRILASNLAKVANCDSPIEDGKGGLDCCDGCISCRKIESFNHPDVSWVEPQGPTGSIKIEEIRRIQKSISLRPYEAKKKVYVIVGADNMTEQASNCLLKTLEEPPGNSLLILTALGADRLLSTIVSRCQIIRLAEKSMGPHASNKLIEQVLLKNSPLKEEELSSLYNESREKISEILDIFSNWYRDISILKANCPVSMLINSERSEDILSQAQDYSYEGLEEIIETISQTKELIRQNVNLKLALGAMMMKINEIRSKDDRSSTG